MGTSRSSMELVATPAGARSSALLLLAVSGGCSSVVAGTTTDAGAQTGGTLVDTSAGSSDSGHGESTSDASTSSTSSTGDTSASEGPDEASSDTTGAAGASSSGEPEPACGNGVLEAFGDVPEECDDGNLVPDDGCSDSCALDVVVFVSSVEYQAGELESTHIADAYCANRADDAGFPEPLRWRAWLSDSDEDARDRFKRGRGRLVLVNGLVVAASWEALLSGQLENPISVTEKSETYNTGVWTGTRPDGTAVPGAEHCADWSVTSILKTGHYGDSNQANAGWTYSADFSNPTQCVGSFPIYCFQSL